MSDSLWLVLLPFVFPLSLDARGSLVVQMRVAHDLEFTMPLIFSVYTIMISHWPLLRVLVSSLS